MKSQLKNYENDIYTRCIVRSNNDLGLATGSFQMGINKVKASTDFISHLGDDIPLRIKNIYESKETNYFISPHYYKEIIIARNTNSGFPPSMSVLLGGKLFQNFYDNKLNYFDQSLPGPLSYEALTYYHFVLRDTVYMDNVPIYKIFLEPLNGKDPGFTGYLYISADTFYLLKLIYRSIVLRISAGLLIMLIFPSSGFPLIRIFICLSTIIFIPPSVIFFLPAAVMN